MILVDFERFVSDFECVFVQNRAVARATAIFQEKYQYLCRGVAKKKRPTTPLAKSSCFFVKCAVARARSSVFRTISGG